MKGKKNKDSRSTRGPIIEPLSDRVLFSADPLGFSDSLHAEFPDTPESTLEIDIAASLPTPAEESRSTEVVLLDTTVPKYRQIIDALNDGSAQTNFIIHTLSSSESIEQVDTLLSDYSNLTGIHFITHGTDATLRLGTTSINNDNLTNHLASLKQWGGALAEHGDILFYGCNFAESEAGKNLVNRIAAATDADVAASDDWTGHENLNANWQLEFTTGPIESNSQHIEDALAQWESVLAAITVNTFEDRVDAPDLSSVAALYNNGPGQGPGPDGFISLREAVIAANAESDADVIHLSSGTPYLLDATADPMLSDEYHGDLNIGNPLTIIGTGTDTTTGTSIDGQYNDRIISIYQANSVSLHAMSLAHGDVSDSGGAIYAFETKLTLDTVNVVDNRALSGGGLFLQNSDVHLKNMSIQANNATQQGGGIYVNNSTVHGYQLDINNNRASNNAQSGQGGGVFVDGLFYLDSSTVKQNNSDTGAGLYVQGELRVTDSTVKHNNATFDGGGIYSKGASYFDRSLIAYNTANSGGGILTDGYTHVEDTTLAWNSALTYGAAVKAISGDTQIHRTTIADNIAPSPGAALYVDPGANIDIQGSLIARHAGTKVIHEDVVSKGFNLTDSAIANAQVSDQQLTATGLETNLADNGGLVNTYKLQSNSTAINAGALVGTGTGQQIVDATGAARNSAADIGAYEFRQPATEVELWYGDYDGDAIHRINLSTGTNQQILDTNTYPLADSITGHSPDSTVPVAIVVDDEQGRLFWVENDSYTNSNGYIGNLNVHEFGTTSDTSNPVNLATGFKQPFGLALDSANERLFISENLNPDNAPNQNRIIEYSTDGTLLQNFLLDGPTPSSTPPQTPLASVTDLEYNASTERLYWTDTGLGDVSGQSRNSEIGIRSIDQDGNVTEHVQNLGARPYDLSLGPNGSVYWIDGDDVFHSASNGTTISNPDSATLSGTPGTMLQSPYAIEYSAENDKVYVSQWGANEKSIIWEIDPALGPNSATIVDDNLIDPASLDANVLAVVTDGPSVTTNQGMTLGDNDTARIDFNLLSATDPDTAPENITFTVVNPLPSNGQLIVDGFPIDASNTTFTQEQLNQGSVYYQQFGIPGIEQIHFFVTDGTYSTETQTFEINALSVNDAPVFDTSADLHLLPVTEDDSNSIGTSVNMILQSVAGDWITDPDPGAIEGIAIIKADDSNGFFEFKANQTDLLWTQIQTTANPVYDGNALLLNPDSLIRFVPNAHFNGLAGNIEFRAHDWTSGHTVGQYVDITSDIGGTRANSAEVELARVNVDNVNDAPIVSAGASTTLTPLQEDDLNSAGFQVTDILQSFGIAPIFDIDASALEGIAVTGLDNTNGQWQYKTASGTWNPTGVLSATNALLLDPASSLRFIPDTDFYGNVSDVIFRAWDQTTGSNGSYADVTINGGSAAFSSSELLAFLQVLPVNDAPQLDSSYSFAQAAISEDTINPPGNTVDQMIQSVGGNAITDVDAADSEGIAIANIDLSNGVWQYKVQPTDAWTDIGAVSNNNALMLQSTSLVRFIPIPNYFGTQDMTFRAWDSSGTHTAGNKADTSINGLSTPFSANTATATLTVSAINDAPELNSIENAPAFFVESSVPNQSGNPIGITGNVNVVDIDHNSLTSATVSISGGFSSAEDNLLFTDQNGIAGQYLSTTGVLTLTGASSVANYQDALRSVTYHNYSDSPSPSIRTVSIEVSDAVLPSNTLSRNIEIIPANDAPVIDPDSNDTTLSGIQFSTNFTEAGPAVAIAAASLITDPDNTTLSELTVTIENLNDTGMEVLAVTAPAGWTETFNSTNGSLHIAAPTGSTFSQWQAILDSVTYENLRTNPDTSPREISILGSDGVNTNNPVAKSVINIIAINNSPTLTGIDTQAANYTENSLPVNISSTVSIQDPDNTSLDSATVTTQNGFSPADVLTFTAQPGISGSYNAVNGTLVLTGSAPLQSYESLLQSVKFHNTSDNPSTLNRTVAFSVNDGLTQSNMAFRDIEVTPVNDAPIISSVEATTASYTENATATPITNGIKISDLDNLQLSSATIAITSGFATGEDTLTFDNTIATGLYGISGAFDSTTGALTLTGNAAIASYEAVIKTVGYLNNSDNPSTAIRTLSISTVDLNGSSGNTAFRNIQTVPVNDPPQTTNGNITVVEDIPFVIPFSDFDFTDLQEGHSLLTITVDSSYTNVSVDNTARTVTYTPLPNNNSPDSFQYSAVDNGGTINGGSDTSLPATMSVNINAVNDTPAISIATLASVDEDSNPSGQTVAGLFANSFSDPDPLDTLAGVAITRNLETPDNGQWQYAIAGGSWQPVGAVSSETALLLDASTAIRFLPAANYHGAPEPLQLRAIDSSFNNNFTGSTQAFADTTSSDTFYSPATSLNATVNAVNDPPVIADTTVPPQLEDTTRSIRILDLFATAYSDVDGTVSIAGIAVTANPATATQGTWQYASDNANWQNINSVSSTTALVLDKNSFVRFLPAPDFNGAPADLVVRAIDGTYTDATTLTNSSRATVDISDTALVVSEEHTVSITVLSVNDAPQGTTNSVTTNEDIPYKFSSTDFGYTDPADSNNFAAITVNTSPAAGTLSLSGALVSPGQVISITDINTGNLVYTPIEHQNGISVATFDFSVRDNGGTINGGIDTDPTSNTITININSVNDAPQGSNGFVPVIEGTPTILSTQDFGFSDNIDDDSIAEIIVDTAPANDGLLLNGVIVTDGQRITASEINSDQLTFIVPLNGGTVQSEMTFRVVDNGGTANAGQDTAQSSNTLSFGITPPSNTPPTSANNTISLREDTVYSFTPGDFSFSDVDGHTLQSVLIVTTPTSGELMLSNSEVLDGDVINATDLINLTFAPAPSESGSAYAAIEYKVIDNGTVAGGGSNVSDTSYKITVAVTPVNDAPTGSDTTIQIIETDNIVFTPADFGFNDTSDQHNLQSITISNSPSIGELLLNESIVNDGTTVLYADILNGQLMYSPAPVETAGSDQFTFTVTDNGGTANGGTDTSTAKNTVNILINSDNTPPSGKNTAITMLEDGVLPLTIDIFGYSDGTENHPMAGVIISAPPVNGSLTHNNMPVNTNDFITTDSLDAGELKFTPDQNDNADNYARIDFLVVDSGSSQTGKHISTATSTLTISVLPVNDTPNNLTVNGELEVTENSSTGIIGSVVFTDADQSDSHQVSVNDSRFEVVNGLLALKPGITIDHESEEVVPLQLSVTDDDGASTLHDFIVQVIDVNEAPEVNQEIDTQSGTGSFSFSVPTNVFFDTDGDTLDLTATLADGSPLPAWLQFDAATDTFTVSEANSTSQQTTSVLLTASDPYGLSTSTVFDINVEPPIAEAYSGLSLPTTPIYPEAAPPIKNSNEEEAESSPDTAGKPEKSENPAIHEEFFEAESAISLELNLDTDALTEVVQLESTQTASAQANTRSENEITVTKHNEFQLSAIETTSVKRAQQDIAAINVLSLKQLSQLADASQSEMEESQAIETKVLASSITLSSSLSVGYILWLLRGGTLLASVMASLPAWRAIDPLPILDGLTGNDEEDTETLESMVKEDESKAREPEKPQM